MKSIKQTELMINNNNQSWFRAVMKKWKDPINVNTTILWKERSESWPDAGNKRVVKDPLLPLLLPAFWSHSWANQRTNPTFIVGSYFLLICFHLSAVCRGNDWWMIQSRHQTSKDRHARGERKSTAGGEEPGKKIWYNIHYLKKDQRQ